MSKSNLRKEYEARMGVVEGSLQLFNAEGKLVYLELSTGFWVKTEYSAAGPVVYSENSAGGWEKFKYNEAGTRVYFESSSGMVIDDRPIYIATIVADQDGKHYELLEVIG
jgi:hypothetical protein